MPQTENPAVRVSDLSRFSVQNNDIQNFTRFAINTVENVICVFGVRTLSTCDAVTRSHTVIIREYLHQ